MPLIENTKELLANTLDSAAIFSKGLYGIHSHRLSQTLSTLAMAVTLGNDKGIATFTFKILQAVEELRESNKESVE